MNCKCDFAYAMRVRVRACVCVWKSIAFVATDSIVWILYAHTDKLDSTHVRYAFILEMLCR